MFTAATWTFPARFVVYHDATPAVEPLVRGHARWRSAALESAALIGFVAAIAVERDRFHHSRRSRGAW